MRGKYERREFSEWPFVCPTLRIAKVPYTFYYMGLFVGGKAGVFIGPAGLNINVFTSDRRLFEGRA